MSDQKSGEPRRRKWPIISLGITLLTIVLTAVCYSQIESLNERFNIDMAMPTIVGAAGAMLSWLTWLAWGIFSRRSILWTALIVLIPVTFFSLFYIDFGGDAEVSFRPRLWDWKNSDYQSIAVDAPALVDLSLPSRYDFPQFLGPARNLRVDTLQLSADWELNPPQQLWKIDVGDAWSGFSIVNGFAVTQEQREANECVTCYDVLTGQLQWIYQVPRRHEDALAMGKVGPRATPAIDGGLVYTTGGNGILDCLDGKDGTLLWSQDVPSMVGIDLIPRTNSRGVDYAAETSSLMWGRSCSPLIYGDWVIVAAGGPLEVDPASDPTCTLIAFNKVTGEEVWRGGKRRISYGSPSLVTIDGRQQIVIMAEAHAVGHDPETGRELWAYARQGSSSGEANCSQVMQVDDNRLLVSKGYNLGGELLRVLLQNSGTADETWQVESLGKNKRVLKTKLTNPVVIDDHAFALSDGFVTCVNLLGPPEGLQQNWRQRTRFKHGQILNVGDKILVHGQDGELALLQVNFDEYEELGKIKTVEGFCWNNLALYGDLLVVRSEREAACFRLPIDGPEILATQSEALPVGADDLKADAQ